jgi:hypothetical protein
MLHELSVIRQYRGAVDAAMALLEPKPPLKAPWDFARLNGRRGVIRRAEDRRIQCVYRFHGIGCYFRIRRKYKVEVDFDGEGRCTGFDSWRIWHFVTENRRLVSAPSFTSYGQTREILQKLHANRYLKQICDRDWYYLTEECDHPWAT